MEIRKNIDAILREKSLSIAELAIKLHCTPSNLYIQLKKEYPNLETLCKIATALQVPISELLQPASPQEKQPAIICPHCGKQITIIASKPEK